MGSVGAAAPTDPIFPHFLNCEDGSLSSYYVTSH
ncbi:MAG: hypothetical protein MAG451_02905 [Anaerolineales bacterium]|nr:hypothetical protein [Anaerolineales bacterium]